MSEADFKQQLVDAVLMLERAGIIDYNGHCSIRTGDNRLLINIGSAPRSALRPDDICAIDMEGRLIEGRGHPPLECHLHCGIYRARADVKAVIHAHARWSTLLTMVGGSYQPVFAQGSLLYPMPVFDSPDSINTRETADHLAATLGSRPAVLMKSHGAATAGADLVEAFALVQYLEENACRQYLAMQIGKPYELTDAEMARCREKLWSASLFKRTWDHFHSKLA